MKAFWTELRLLLVLAGPLILAQLAGTSMGFVDTLMVGRLGDEALAGIALGNTLYFFVLLLLTGVVLAVGPTVSQAHGAGDEEGVARAARQGLWLALGGTLLALPLFWNATTLLRLMGQEAGTAALAGAYIQAVSWGFLPALGLTALRGLLEGLSNPRPIMVIALVGVGLNVAANDVLMFGRFGFPALGLVGTGYATTIVSWLMFALAAIYVQVTLKGYRIFSRLRTPDPRTLRDLFTVGWPIGLTLGFEVGLFTITALLMGLLGATQLAAHQIALQTASLTFMVPLGLSIALVGARRAGGGARGRRGGAARRERRHRPQRGFYGAHRAHLLGAAPLHRRAFCRYARPRQRLPRRARRHLLRRRRDVPGFRRPPGERVGRAARPQGHAHAHAHLALRLLGCRARRGRLAGFRPGLGRARAVAGPGGGLGHRGGAPHSALLAYRAPPSRPAVWYSTLESRDKLSQRRIEWTLF